jgi:membrane protein implicated in regulation of membrane protease activity
MKQNSLLLYIILYVIVACVVLAIATLTRIFTVSMGFDGFTAFMVFIVALAVQVVVYLSIHVVLQNLMLPWIGEWLSKTPYIRKKIENRQIPTIVEDILPAASAQPSLEDIRNEQLQNRTKEQEDKFNIVLNYTRKSFALYLSDEYLDVLYTSTNWMYKI